MVTEATGQFEAYGVSHWLVLVVFVVGLVPTVALGRHVVRAGRVGTASRTAAVVCVVVMLPLQVIDLLPGNFELHTTLPLQLCDLALVATVVALWTRHPAAVALCYFWGLTLTPQALLTPSLAQEFPHPRFLAFWSMHLLVTWAAVYLVWGLRIRPDWRGYARTVAATATWLVAVLVCNALLGTNYGFVNRKPPSGSALDLLGPWPWYLLQEVLVVAVVWALMTWPWTRRPSCLPGPTGASWGGTGRR